MINWLNVNIPLGGPLGKPTGDAVSKKRNRVVAKSKNWIEKIKEVIGSH